MAEGPQGHRAAGEPRHSRHRRPLRGHRVRYGLSEGDARPRHQRLHAGQDPQPGDHRHLQCRRHHLRAVAPLCGHGPLRLPQADSQGPAGGRPDGAHRGLHQQGGLLGAQPRHRHRATPLDAVVPVDEALCRHRPAARDERRAEVLSHEIQEHLQELAGEHPGLVHLAPAVVGTPHSRLLLWRGRKRLRGG